MKKCKIHWSITSRVMEVNEILYDAGFNTQIPIDFNEEDDGSRTYYQQEGEEQK